MTTYVTTIQTQPFTLAPASPLPSVGSLIAGLLRLLAGWLLALSHSIEPGCCDNPTPKEMEEGWWWCTNCGHTWKKEATPPTSHACHVQSQDDLYTQLDRSLKAGYLQAVDWARRES